MKKKVALFITLFVSLFIYSERVEAAKEMTCLYYDEREYQEPQQTFSVMMSQNSKGDIEVYRKNFSSSELLIITSIDGLCNGKNWVNDSQKKIYDDKSIASEFSECPKYVSYDWDKDTINYFFSSDYQYLDSEYGFAYVLVDTKNCPFCNNIVDKSWKSNCQNVNGDDSGSASNRFFYSDDLSEQIKNTKWSHKCWYSGFDLYFNDDSYIIDIVRSDIYGFTAEFSIQSLLEANGGNCPMTLYTTQSDDGNTLIINGNSVSDFKYKLIFDGFDFNAPDDVDINTEVNNCHDLFGDDIYNKINDYFKIVRIIIPILLIGFGIFDFTKAVFGNEENMKKVKRKFILRIVAAVIFFLLPIFIKFILSIANSAWGFINTDTCIRKE